MTAQTIDFALYYAKRGLRVFPTDEHKHPCVKDWPHLATLDETQIQHWWLNAFPNAGIGIATGKDSGIIVMDIDPKNGGESSFVTMLLDWGELPNTAEVITGGGGRHIYFVHPGEEIRNSASKLYPGIDIRGDGGYVVAPPSMHESGRRYDWADGHKLSQTQIADMPRWMIQRLSEKPPVQPAQHLAPVVGERIATGSRNQILTSLAGTMRRRGFTYDAIFQALMAENNNRCDPPLSADEISSIAKSVSRYEPTAPPQFTGQEAPIQARDALDAYQIGVDFMDRLQNLDDISIQTQIGGLDYSLGGLERKTLTVLAARPSMGKTTLAWQIARNIAASSRRVLVYSLEMSAVSLWAKAVCGELGLRWRDVRGGQILDGTIKMMLDKTTELMDRYGEYLLIEDWPNDTRTMIAGIEKYQPDVVFCDHLRLMSDPGDKETKRLGRITQNMKEAAKAYNLAFVCLAQLNRGLETRDNKRPTLADLRDSGEIEENADVVLMIHSDEYFTPTGNDSPITEVLVRKFRDDVKDQKILLQFDKHFQRFDSVKAETINLRGDNDYADR